MKDKRSNTVWLAEDEPRPEVLKTGFRSRKMMFTIFFNTQGPVVVDIMPDKATITATYYTTSVLPKNLLHIQSTARTRPSVSNPVASRQYSSSQSSHHTDVP